MVRLSMSVRSLLLATSVTAFVIQPRCHSLRPSALFQSDDNNDEELFYDDFGGAFVGESSADLEAPAALQSRLSQVQTSERERDEQLTENWRTGNWQVRGFSLDPESAENDLYAQGTKRTQICEVVADPSDAGRVWISRDDGSLITVELGDDYMTAFRSTLSASAQGEGIKISAKLQRDEDMSTQNWNKPFEIVGQVQVDIKAPDALCVAPEHVFTASGSTIQQWLVGETDVGQLSLVKAVEMNSGHAAKVMSMHTLALEEDEAEPTLVVSAAVDGSLALWDLSSGDLLFQCDSSNIINCSAVHGTLIFLGTEEGHVLAYDVKDWLAAAGKGASAKCPVPSGQWTAGVESAPVTAMATAGKGTLGRGQDSVVVLTGDATGMVKQWQVIERRDDSGLKLDQWPKMATQRLPQSAHLFSGHDGPVTTLVSVDSTKFLSASTDGTVVAWNAAKGTNFFRMDGFEAPSSLCVIEHVLITNGMKHYVCVHDFDVDPDEQDFQLDEDDW